MYRGRMATAETGQSTMADRTQHVRGSAGGSIDQPVWHVDRSRSPGAAAVAPGASTTGIPVFINSAAVLLGPCSAPSLFPQRARAQR